MNNPQDCIFCSLPSERIVAQSLHLKAFEDKFPVSPGHVLVVPKRHCVDYFALSAAEQGELPDLLQQLKERALAGDASISGFNIGANCGESAGQTVFHCHIHLIPRRDGDIENPRGGVRGVIPDKRIY